MLRAPAVGYVARANTCGRWSATSSPGAPGTCDHRRRLDELKPEVERLQRRYANDPGTLWRETAKFYRVRGVKPVDSAGLFGGLAQAPVFAALYSALRNGVGSGIRFLWIGDTALPNVLLTVLVAGTTVASLAATPAATTTPSVRLVTFAIFGAMTIWFLSSTSALFALSTGAGSAVGMLQGWILRRDQRVSNPPAVG